VLGVEAAELLVGGVFLAGQVGGWGVAGLEAPDDLWGGGAGHVGVDAQQPRGGLDAHGLGHRGAPVAALGHELKVAQATHQHDPGARDPHRVPAGGGRPGREPVTGQGGDHHMERVRLAAAVGGRIGEGPDDLQLLDDRAGPAVGDDQREGVGMWGADVEEVDVEAVDLGGELRQRVQPGLDLAPVVGGRPVAGELLHGRQRHPLAVVVDRLALGPAGRIDAPAQLDQVLVGDADLEGTDRCGAR
jgi:hypothetical protein